MNALRPTKKPLPSGTLGTRLEEAWKTPTSMYYRAIGLQKEAVITPGERGKPTPSTALDVARLLISAAASSVVKQAPEAAMVWGGLRNGEGQRFDEVLAGILDSGPAALADTTIVVDQSRPSATLTLFRMKQVFKLAEEAAWPSWLEPTDAPFAIHAMLTGAQLVQVFNIWRRFDEQKSSSHGKAPTDESAGAPLPTDRRELPTHERRSRDNSESDDTESAEPAQLDFGDDSEVPGRHGEPGKWKPKSPTHSRRSG